MQFFKFIDRDHKSLSQANNRIHYKKGEEIIVPDANSDPNVQCSSGIHCLYMESTIPISEHSVLFGPKIAILEAEKEDVVYFSVDGKCRLRKCKVIDVIELNDLPFDKLIGNGNLRFAYLAVHFMETLNKEQIGVAYQHFSSVEFCSFISDFLYKITSDNSEVEDFLVSNNWHVLAVKLAINSRKYYSDELLDYLCKNNCDDLKLQWINVFGPDEKLGNSLSPYSIYKYVKIMGGTINDHRKKKLLDVSFINDVYFILQAVKNLKTKDKELEEAILNSHNYNCILDYSYHSNTIYPETIDAANEFIKFKKKYDYISEGLPFYVFVSHFDYDKNILDIIESDAFLSYDYYQKNRKLTDRMKNKIKTDKILSYNLLYDFGYDNELYFSVNSLDKIIRMLQKHGYNKTFIEETFHKLEFSYSTNGLIRGILDILKQFPEDKILQKMFFMSNPILIEVMEYCNYIGFDQHVEDFISNHNISITCLKDILTTPTN